MAKTYSKREFLRILGIGMALLPLASCFNNQSDDKSSHLNEEEDATTDKKQTDKNLEKIAVTDADILLLSRDEAAFESYSQGFNKRIKKVPKYIAVCYTEKGIQYAIQVANQHDLPIAIRSGGHSFEGFSSNDGGLVINVSHMKSVNWLNSQEIEIGPGLMLEELHQILFPKNKLLPAGSCGTVGISGLTLGGGYGFFSRKYGLTCDSLLSATIITADGTILECNETQNSDLYWALKGGGNGNYGVVSKLRYKLYDMPPTFDSHVLKFKNMNAERFHSTLTTWFICTQQFPNTSFGAYVLNSTTLTILITDYEHHDLTNIIAPLISEADSHKPTLQANLPLAMKRYYGRKGPIYFKNASCGLFEGMKDFENITDALFNTVINHKGMILQVNTLGGKINDTRFEKESCYPHRQLPYLGELQAYWANPSQEAYLLEGFEKVQQIFRNNGMIAHYRNYPDINFKEWQSAYYGKNYPKLQVLKRKYDPKNVFRYEQSITT